MKTTSWILVALALVVLGAIGGLMLSGGQGEPRDLLESALRRFNGPEQDTVATLKELELALRSAEAEEDGELAADILIARGRVLREVEAYGPARADFERALERYRPGAADIELELVSLDEETGDLGAGLARALRIAERDPSRLEAWTHAGQILTRMSEEGLTELEAICEANLSDEGARRALDHARRAVGMDVDDPLRVSQLAGLRSFFNPPDQKDSLRAMTLVDEASTASSRAREALVRSFSGQLDRDAVQSYLKLLARSGRSQDAVDFGLAVVPQRSVNSSPEFMEQLARVLIDAGRPRAACDAIQQHFNRSVQAGQQFYLTWCEALYKSERWKELPFVANLMRMAGDEQHRSIGVFYMGIGRARANQTDGARDALELYTRRDPVEPFPGGVALAWRTLAETLRSRGETAREAVALRQAVQLEPNADGGAWLRLFQIIKDSEPGNLSEAELALTRALCLLPMRTGELMPTWLDLGRRRMRAAGTELELLMADQRRTGHLGPAPEAGPYELFRFGEMHRDAREPLAAAACARRLLVAFPGFVPAIDLLGDALLAIGDLTSASELWIERLRRAPGDQPTLKRLARLPAGILTSEQLIELMQLDPENTGRLQVARTLKAEGQPHAALAGLDALPLEPLGDEGVLLASELLIDVGREADALAMLDRLSPGRRLSARAFELSLDAARRLGKQDQLLGIIANPPPAQLLGSSAMIERVDGMLARGQVDAARALLGVLDSHESTRTREVLLRSAAIALLEHDMTAVQDELDRAQAFDDGGAVAFGRLLAKLESREYNRLPIYVRAVYETPFQPTRLQAAILSILDERLEDAKRMIEDARRKDPRDPYWALLDHALEILAGRNPDVSLLVDANTLDETMFTLRGGDRQRNPRPLFARMLALDNPDWRFWAVCDLSRSQPTLPGSLWATYMVGRGLSAAKLAEDAESAWRTVLRVWPSFEPAWDALEMAKLERVKRFDHVEMVRVRATRRLALGSRPGEEAEELLTEAWAREIAGNLGGALESVQAAVVRDPNLIPAWFKLGQLSHRLPDWDAAIDALRRAARAADVESSSPIVEEFVAVLRDARAAAPQNISADLVRSELAELALRFPDDPLVALAQARAELDQEDIVPAVRVARAYERLDRFRMHLDDMAQLKAAEANAQAAASAKPGGIGAPGDAKRPRPARSGAPTANGVPAASGQGPSLDSLRAGSTGAWKDFYQTLEPARAEAFVRDELDRRPGSLRLWHMLGETLVAQNRREEATRLFELVARMVPDGQTHRALARLYAEGQGEYAKVEAAVTAAVQLEGRKAPDVDLLYTMARVLTVHPAGVSRGLQILAGLWQQRDAALGRIKDVDIGQLYGTTMVQRADPADRQLATNLLQEVSDAIVGDRSRKNLVDALVLLASQIPARSR